MRVLLFFLFQPLLESGLCSWFTIKSLENLVHCRMDALRQLFLLFNPHFSAYCVAWREAALGKLSWKPTAASLKLPQVSVGEHEHSGAWAKNAYLCKGHTLTTLDSSCKERRDEQWTTVHTCEASAP